MMSLFDRKRVDRGLNHPWMILLAVLFLFSGPASSGDLPSSGNDSFGNAALQGDLELDVFDGFAVAGEAELAEIRGGESTAVSIQDMQSTVEGNVVSGNVTTGSVNIGEDAFTLPGSPLLSRFLNRFPISEDSSNENTFFPMEPMNSEQIFGLENTHRPKCFAT